MTGMKKELFFKQSQREGESIQTQGVHTSSEWMKLIEFWCLVERVVQVWALRRK